MENIHEKVTCIYCGAEIEWIDSNNTCDNGLHPDYSKFDEHDPKCCCSYCNIVTGVNRALANVIHSKWSGENSYKKPDDGIFLGDPSLAAFELRQAADYLEQNREKLIAYYDDSEKKIRHGNQMNDYYKAKMVAEILSKKV